MKALTGMSGAIFSETAQRLVRYGLTEREAWTVSRCVRLTANTTDADCENAVILALVAASEAVNGRADVTYVSGVRRDTLRLEGK